MADGSEALPAALDRALAELHAGAPADFAAQRDLLAACRQRLLGCADAWVEAACADKQLDPQSPVAAEEWASGPLPVARFLAGLEATFAELARGHLPQLPPLAAAGLERLALPPIAGLADGLLLRGHGATVELQADAAQRPPPRDGGLCTVLGAGNVSSMPVGDALHHVFLGGCRVLLKASPLHRRLLPVFEQALQPLVAAGRLRIVKGDANVGAAAAADPRVAAVHLTGARRTAELLFADPRLRTKRCSSELGNVTPVLVVPAAFTERELRHQARQLAAAVADNAGCNCVSPRVLLTAAGWPQRSEFLALVEQAMASLPPRPPFHPAAASAYEIAAERPLPPDGLLRPLLRRDVDPQRSPRPFADEQFAPVLLDVPLAAADEAAFLAAAAAFANDRCAGTLAAHLLAPAAWLQGNAPPLRATLRALRFGTVAIDTWAALGYALMTAPWGGAPPPAGDPLGSGAGHVHGTLLLDGIRQVVVHGPSAPRPLPPWLPWHRRRGAALRALLRFYCAPAPRRLLAVLAHGLRP